ncbi:MAG: VOC family protein [Actinomycetota bacterium]
MDQRLSVITLGVADVARARAFYEALGWTSPSPPRADAVFFQAGPLVVALWGRDDLALDSGVDDPGGWGGVTLAHNLPTERDVDDLLARARDAGATIARAPGPTFWGGYSGVFVDPDGHPWEIAVNPHWPLGADGAVTLPA